MLVSPAIYPEVQRINEVINMKYDVIITRSGSRGDIHRH